MDIYCLKCRAKTPTDDITYGVTKNGRHIAKGICTICGKQKNKFIKQSIEAIAEE